MTASPRPEARPERWRHATRAWRASASMGRRRVDLLLGARTAAGYPVERARFVAMGLPNDAIEAALRQIRAVDQWGEAWTWTAQRFLGDARRHLGDGRPIEAAMSRRQAALAYHVAQLFAADDPKKARALRSSSTTLFAQALPVLMPSVVRIESAWRATTLPGYLARPSAESRPTPLVVLLNGTTTSKEETLLWADPLLAHGLAVLALDWPGTGETASEMAITADCDDLTDGVIALAKDDPLLDADRVALVGFSLGGALAVRAAAFDRRIAAVVAVTPPYAPGRWLSGANPILVEMLAAAAGGADRLAHLTAGFDLTGIVARLRAPLLVFGAGRDLVVPPEEAVRVVADGGALATLVWYAAGRHGLYAEIGGWTEDAGRWLGSLLCEPEPDGSTPVDRAAATQATMPASLPVAPDATHRMERNEVDIKV